MREKDAYVAIEKALGEEGYRVQQEARIETLDLFDGETRAVDLVGFKWTTDDEIAAVAVEAKLGDTPSVPLLAVSQAAQYQLVFPEVYVAAQTKRERLSYAETVLRQLGLGYIQIDEECRQAAICFRPVPAIRCYESYFREVLRPAGLLWLSVAELVKEEFEIGKKIRRFYMWTPENRQVSLQFAWELGEARACCHSEMKPVVQRIHECADPSAVDSILGRAPSNYSRCIYIAHGEKKPWGHLDRSRFEGDAKYLEASQEGIAEALSRLRAYCVKAGHTGEFAFGFRELWTDEQFITRDEAVRRLGDVIPALVELRSYFNEFV